MCVCMCVCAYMHACMHTCIHVCIVYMCMRIYGYVCMYVYACVCVCVCMYVYVYIYMFFCFFFTVISPRFKLHLSVEKLKCDTMMPTFPPLQFYEIIVTQYQLRLTDAPEGVLLYEGAWPQNSSLKLLSGPPRPPDMEMSLLIWKCPP